jgi:hypothetical protein
MIHLSLLIQCAFRRKMKFKERSFVSQTAGFSPQFNNFYKHINLENLHFKESQRICNSMSVVTDDVLNITILGISYCKLNEST